MIIFDDQMRQPGIELWGTPRKELQLANRQNRAAAQ